MSPERLGLDIGSRTIKLVRLDGDRLVKAEVRDTGHDPLATCRQLLGDLDTRHLTATGYGRRLVADQVGCEVISEIKAVGLGARFLLPTCRAVLDLGGQDTKAVALDSRGRLQKFLMNDRCAAGTGRSLEVMAAALSCTYDEFVQAALSAKKAESLNSICAVFAESEVVSLVARGARRDEIALGIHQAIVTRTLALLRGIPLDGDLLFAGGGAMNACLTRELEQRLGQTLHRPEHPRIVAALGAALYIPSQNGETT